MLRKLSAVFLLVAVVSTGLVAQPGTKDKATKAEPGTITGKVVSVDETKGTVTINVDGKNQTFTVNADTSIVGPQGGISKERLKDDRFTKGYEITITPGTDPKIAGKIRLDYRPTSTTKDTPATKDAPMKDAPPKDTPAKDAPPKDTPAKDKTTPPKDKTTTPPKDKTTPPKKDKK